MGNQGKEKEPLIAELATLKRQVADLEKKAAEYQRDSKKLDSGKGIVSFSISFFQIIKSL
jgi:hypothetical protein